MLDEQYIRIMGSRLERFRPTSRGRYECRCPLCGDSKKDMKKARGNFYMWKGSWLYKCHNCGKSYRIPTLLEIAFPDLHEEYVMGMSRNKVNGHTPIGPTKKEQTYTEQKPLFDQVEKAEVEIDLPKLSDLPLDHPAVSYASDRKLPTKYWHDLYYAEKFKEFSNSLVPDAFANTDFDDARIVIPFRDEKGSIFAFQGRALNYSKLKYLTVKIDQDKQKIFGLDRIDKTKPVYVVEGPFDSLFIDNAIGTADSSLDSIDGIYIWDNEPRSPIICKKIEKAIDDGHSVVIWKKSHRFNDINDAIVDGFSIESINRIVRKRTFKGLDALVELNNWRKA